MARPDAILSVLGFAALGLVWGTQFLVIRAGQTLMPALLTASLRFAVLALASALAVRITRASAPPGTLVLRVGFGLAQALSFGLLYWAQRSLDSGVAGLLSSTTPLFIAILAHVWIGERLARTTAVALVLGFGGACILVVSARGWGTPAIAGAMLLILVGELAGATNKVLGKALITRVPAPILLRDMGATVALTTAIGWFLFERNVPVHFSARSVGAFLYLGLVASFAASGLYMKLLRVLPVTTLGYLQFLTAMVAALTGVVIGGEPVRAGSIAGGAAIVVGLAVLAVGRAR